MDTDFFEKLKEVADNLPAILQAKDLFNKDVVALLDDLSGLEVQELVDDLEKGTYLGNRKTDINLALNMVGITAELILDSADEMEAIWTDSLKTVLYDSAKVTFVDGEVIDVPFTFDGNSVNVSTHGDLLLQFNNNIAFLNKLENTLFSTFAADVVGEIIRVYDVIGQNSNIEKIQLNAVSGTYREQMPVYYWAKTTSAMKTLSMRSGDLIKIGNVVDEFIGISSSLEELIEIQKRLPTLIDTFSNDIPNGDETIYNNLDKLTLLHTNLQSLILLYEDMKDGGTNHIQTLSDVDYKAKIETVANSTYKTKLEEISTNLAELLNTKLYSQNASEKLDEIKNIRDEFTTFSPRVVEIASSGTASITYNSSTGEYVLLLPKGEQGERGDAFTINASGTLVERSTYDNQAKSFSYLSLDETPTKIYFKNSSISGDWNAGVEFGKGDKGDKGVSIVSVIKTSTSGLVDTYTINFDDSSTSTFSITNGVGDLQASNNLSEVDNAIARVNLSLYSKAEINQFISDLSQLISDINYEEADSTILKEVSIGSKILAPNGNGSQLTGLKASNHAFTNTGTTLESTNVNTAIVELYDNSLTKVEIMTTPVIHTNFEFHKFTMSEDTTFTLDQTPTTPVSFMLEITNGGAFITTWFDTITWSDGVAPVLTTTGTDILVFLFNGTSWRGLKTAKDIK